MKCPVLIIVLVIGVVGCSSSEAGSNHPQAKFSPWSQAPNKGSWDYGDVSFGKWSKNGGPSGEYVFKIDEPPTLTTRDGGKTVNMSSSVRVKRVKELDPEASIVDTVDFFFTPGNLNIDDHSEVYGTDPSVTCSPQKLSTGGQAICELTFAAPAQEIPNSYWDAAGLAIGTWPGQTA